MLMKQLKQAHRSTYRFRLPNMWVGTNKELKPPSVSARWFVTLVCQCSLVSALQVSFTMVVKCRWRERLTRLHSNCRGRESPNQTPRPTCIRAEANDRRSCHPETRHFQVDLLLLPSKGDLLYCCMDWMHLPSNAKKLPQEKRWWLDPIV